MYFVYVLKDKVKDSLYYGYTNNLDRRFAEHSKENDYELIYYEAYKSEFDARRRERKSKDYGQAISGLKSRLRESLK